MPEHFPAKDIDVLQSPDRLKARLGGQMLDRMLVRAGVLVQTARRAHKVPPSDAADLPVGGTP